MEALFVTLKAVPAAVAVRVVALNAPEETTPKVEVPVTPKVPPMEALFVTVKAVPAAVAVRVVALNAPEDTTPKVEVPVTPRVPPIVALLVIDKAVPVPDNVKNPVRILPVAMVVPFP